MKYQLFTEVQLNQDLSEYNLSKGTTAIIVDYCSRPTENGYILEVLDSEGIGYNVIAVSEAQISVCEMAIL